MSMKDRITKTAIEIEGQLDALAHMYTTAYESEVKCAEGFFRAQNSLASAEALLATNRAAAVAAKLIQQKENGANQELRDAHEQDHLKVEYQGVALAQAEVALARHDLEQTQRAKSYVSQVIKLTQTRAGIVRVLLEMGLPDEEQEQEGGADG